MINWLTTLFWILFFWAEDEKLTAQRGIDRATLMTQYDEMDIDAD